MKVWIITMAFPAPSETFASNEVLALGRVGTEVSVHSLRPPHLQAASLIAERGLAKLKITHNSWSATLAGLRVGFTQPRLFTDVLAWIVRSTWNSPKHLIRSLILLPRSLELYNKIQSGNPDVVHLYWSHYPSLVGYLVQTKLPHILVSISFVAHDIYAENYACSRVVARRADFIHTVTAANIPAIESLGISRERISVFYHGINLRQIPVPTQKIPLRIITVGRLVPGKGFEETLQVFSRVLQQWSNASLVILGDGSEREKLEQLANSLGIAHAVSFRGHVSHDVVFQEMAVSEIFLFMSEAERLPNVVKEAMACRCLCVITKTPGIEELIQPYRQGYVIPQGDIETPAKLISTAFASPTKTFDMVECAYEHVTTYFDTDRIIMNLKQHWQKQCAIKAASSR